MFIFYNYSCSSYCKLCETAHWNRMQNPNLNLNSKAYHVIPKVKHVNMPNARLCVILKWDDRLQKTESEGEASLISIIALHLGSWKSSDAFDFEFRGKSKRGRESLLTDVCMPFNEVAHGLQSKPLKRTKLTGCRPVSPLWNWVQRKWSFFFYLDFFFPYHTIKACPQKWP